MGDDGAMVTNAWVDEGSQRHYVGADGKEQTGWITVNGKQYFLNEEGILADSGWMKQGINGILLIQTAVQKPVCFKVKENGIISLLTASSRRAGWKVRGNGTIWLTAS